MDLEEEIISWAESESHQVFGLVLDAIKSKTPPGAHYEEARGVLFVANIRNFCDKCTDILRNCRRFKQ